MRWSLPTRIAFRFFFVFFALITFPFPLTAVPGFARWWSGMLNKAIARAARTLFGVTLNAAYTGSGDRAVDWARLCAFVVVAVIVTVVWSVLDRRRTNYTALHRWFHLYLRFALATAMIAYGAYKVVPTQFVTPSLDRFLEPFGDQSPMGLLWNFMGASAPYTIFGGLGELVGGLLLTNRRTSLLGALISAGVLTQVVMLNFAFDVDVKLYSSTLLLMAIVVIAPDASRLMRFFLLEPVPRLSVAFRIAIALFVVYVVVVRFHDSWKYRREYLADLRTPLPIAGIWNAGELVATDAGRWRRLIIDGKEELVIQNMDDSQVHYWLTLDEKNKTILLERHGAASKLDYAQPDARTLLVRGVLEGKQIAATFHKDTQRTFLLTSRGFHWVSERAFNH